ncbi:hypothetical protein [Streptomyces zaomyceticus]|uniref:hypothetical protein n=1 Tax=Streptomyces zaomyceticus TaxID=68286 RepID=UPI00342E23DD
MPPTPARPGPPERPPPPWAGQPSPAVPSPSPKARAEAEARAENHLFHLTDTGTPRTGDPTLQPPTPTSHQLATSAPGTITLNSTLADHYPHVTVEVWNTPPPLPAEGPPGESTKLTLRLHGDLLLASGVSHLAVPLPLDVPAGAYTVTVTRTPPAAPPTTALPRHAEHWLLQIGPPT